MFPARTCSNGVFKRAGQIGRPCLLGYIGKCSAPCVGRVSADEHRQIVDEFCDFMAGKTDAMIRRLEKQMAAASAELEFELAARLRDDLGALRRSMEKQAVVLRDGADADVVAFATDEPRPRCRCSTSGRAGCAASAAGWSTPRRGWTRTPSSPDSRGWSNGWSAVLRRGRCGHPARGAGARTPRGP